MTKLCNDAQSTALEDLVEHINMMSEHMEESYCQENIAKAKVRNHTAHSEKGDAHSVQEDIPNSARKTGHGFNNSKDEAMESRAKDG